MSLPLEVTIGPTTIKTFEAVKGATIEFDLPHPGFETTFTGGEWDGDWWRYATEEQAITEHGKAVEQLTLWHAMVQA